MTRNLLITYRYHSGFTAALDDTLLVFDYWEGENGALPPEHCLTPSYLQGFRRVFVFVSHEHRDHFDPVIYEWRGLGDITYVVAADMPVTARGRRMAPGDRLQLAEDVTVRAFASTDLGVSYLVDLAGIRLFHAGDLNFWHWREESTIKEIEEAEAEYHAAVAPLIGEKIDVSFFPVDPRQGTMYDAGANYFIMTVKPRLLLPMHFWGRKDLMSGFARQARTQDTEIVPLTEPGQQLSLTFDEAGYITVQVLQSPVLYFSREELPPDDPGGRTVSADDPFGDTDLPVRLDDD